MDANISRIMRDPEFQRFMQRFARQRPEQRALVNAAAIMPGFAKGYEAQLMEALRTGLENQQFEDRMENRRKIQQFEAERFGKKLDFSRTQADRDFGLAQDALDWNKTQSRWALPINVGSVLANTYTAGKIYDQAQKNAAEQRAYRERILKYLGG